MNYLNGNKIIQNIYLQLLLYCFMNDIPVNEYAKNFFSENPYILCETPSVCQNQKQIKRLRIYLTILLDIDQETLRIQHLK